MRTRTILPCLRAWHRVPAAFHHLGGGAADRGVRRRAGARAARGARRCEEVVSVRPVRDVYALPGPVRLPAADPPPAVLRHRRRHPGRRAGGLGDRRCRGSLGRAGRPGGAAPAGRCGRCSAHLDALRRRGRPPRADVVQVVGAAVVRRGPGARRPALGRPLRRLLGVPRRQGRTGGVRPRRAGAGAARRSCGVDVVPQAFLGEVVLDGAGRRRRARRLDAARVVGPAARRGNRSRTSTRRCGGLRADELDALDWIAADRPLLPAVRTLLTRLSGAFARLTT